MSASPSFAPESGLTASGQLLPFRYLHEIASARLRFESSAKLALIADGVRR